MKKQVDKAHYEFSRYVDKRRWASMWHQLDEVVRLKPEKVLEIGPGPGIFKATAISVGLTVETLDIDPELNPDHVASVFEMPFDDGAFDVVCAFQMLEHLPYEKSLEAFREMTRVARTGVVISLPDAKTLWPMSIYVPKIGNVHFFIPRPRLFPQKHIFDGEHCWEINKKGFSLRKIVEEFVVLGWSLEKTFRVSENPYHRFFIFIPR
ncbi:MAG: methyltransferase domain-containing protein [Halothiobacillus sp.]|jgi:predicted SAM-dependent methyltransferase|nr:methyltransferase domain-containing protein [Halothiobacillus sp.]